MNIDFIKINNKYINISYDYYNFDNYEYSLEDKPTLNYSQFYLVYKDNDIGEYNFFLKKLTIFKEPKSIKANDKLIKLIKNNSITLERINDEKQFIENKKADEDKNYIKVNKTINFLEDLLNDVREDNKLFKKIGDFIKYLED